MNCFYLNLVDLLLMSALIHFFTLCVMACQLFLLLFACLNSGIICLQNDKDEDDNMLYCPPGEICPGLKRCAHKFFEPTSVLAAKSASS